MLLKMKFQRQKTARRIPDGVHENVEGAGAVARLRHGHLGRPLRRRLRLGQERAAPRLLAQLPEGGEEGKS